MATLQKIRNKSWLLFAIILLALLAFILGDLLDSRRSIFFSASSRDMAKVGSVKVDYDNYRKTYEQARQQGQQGQESAMEQQVVLGLLQQELLKEEYNKLGINVTDQEVSAIMKSPMSAYMFYQLQNTFGTSDPNAIYDMVCNPTKYNIPAEAQSQLTDMWAAMEQQAEDNMKSQAYFNLVNGLFTANELDAKSRYADNTARMNLQYASIASPAGNPEEAVSDEDMRQMWQDKQYAFSTYGLSGSIVKEPVRAIRYITVTINPSQDDVQAAREVVRQAYTDLQASEGIASILDAPGFVRTTQTAPRASVRSRAGVNSMPDSLLAVGGTYMSPFSQMNNTFTVAKVTDVSAKVDTVKVALFVAQTPEQTDSILNLLQNGTKYAELAETNPGQVIEEYVYTPMADKQLQGDEAVLNQILKIKDVNDGLYANAIGTPVAYNDTVQGLNMIYSVLDRNQPREYVEMQVFTYTVDPSAETRANMHQDLASFIASNNNAKSFVAAADTTPQYTAVEAFVSASTPYIGGGYNYFDDTRKVVKWAMDAKTGNVSPIFDVRTMKNQNMPNSITRDVYMVAALTDILNDEYVPYNSELTRPSLEAMVRADKAAQAKIEEYAGKANSLQGYAELMNTSVATDSTAVFTNIMRQDPVLTGIIAAAAPGTLVGPVKGENQIIVFTVSPVDAEARPYNYATDSMDYINAFGFPVNRQTGAMDQATLINMLIGNREFKNQTLNMVAGQDE